MDNTDTFALISKMDSIRLAWAIDASKRWEVHYMDVKSAFIHDEIQEEIYMKKPEGFVTAAFTTHGWSHFYGLPCLSADSLDPVDYFCTFNVSNIIPKNTCYFLYVTFKHFLAYTHRYNP